MRQNKIRLLKKQMFRYNLIFVRRSSSTSLVSCPTSLDPLLCKRMLKRFAPGEIICHFIRYF
jgi:hypothetical protein